MRIIPRRSDKIMWRAEEDGNVLLYSPDTEQFVVLNETAASVWKLSNGHNTFDEISRVIQRKYAIKDKNAVLKDIRRLLERMRKNRLLEY